MNAPRSFTPLDVVFHWLMAFRALHPFPSLLVTLLTLALVPLADRGAPPARYIALGLGMLCFQFTIGLVNDLADREQDRAAKPWKPLASGRLPVAAARALALGLGFAGLLLTLTLPIGAWPIGAAGFGCGLVYDVWLKRTGFSWLPYSLAFPLIPVWVYVASDAWDALLWWTLPLGSVLGLALHLANQAPDASNDAGLPGRLGEARSRLLALALFGLAAAAVATVLAVESPARALTACAVALLTFAAAPWATRLLGRDGGFALLAVASAVLAVLFISAV